MPGVKLKKHRDEAGLSSTPPRRPKTRHKMLTRNVNRRQEQRPVVCRLTRGERVAKRCVDVVCATTGLIVLSPVFLIITIVLLLQGRGGVIYSQERIGLGGKPFRIYKFRTMRADAEAEGPQLEQANDSRLTPTGGFLRRHHIDELPQLWNVLKGDMSMVGPRPERQYFIDRIMEHDPRYKYLFQVRPGVTSEATLYNGYTDTMDKMLERLNMDLRYLETASLWQDFAIMGKTLCALV